MSVSPRSADTPASGTTLSASSATGTGSLGPLLLTFLWIVWAILLFGGFALGPLNEEETQRINTFSRMGSSAVLVLAGAVAWFFARRRAGSLFAGFLAVGMLLGFIGDLFNAGLLQNVVPLEDPVLGGMISFGLGHIAYIGGCLLLARRAGLTYVTALGGALLGLELFGFVGWWAIVYRGQEPTLIHYLALPYSLLLAGTAGIAVGLALQSRRLIPLAVGAVLFLISDLILAWRLFHGSFYLAGDAVWLTYGPGQMLIVFSIPLGLSLLSMGMPQDVPSEKPAAAAI
jgi:hypothetical protein